MKTNDRHRHTWLLCLVLTVALYALPGCQTQPAQEPTSAPYPEPATVIAVQSTQEPTSAPYPAPATVIAVQPTQEPTLTTVPEPPTATVEQEPTATEMRTFPRVTVEQLKQWIAAGEPLFFIDARSSDVWSAATTKVPGALRVPPHDVEPHLAEIPKDRRLVIYCTLPNEASAASVAAELWGQGWPVPYLILGGYNAWVAAGMPVEPK